MYTGQADGENILNISTIPQQETNFTHFLKIKKQFLELFKVATYRMAWLMSLWRAVHHTVILQVVLYQSGWAPQSSYSMDRTILYS